MLKDEALVVWVDRIGILLAVLSFWSAAPEVLGEHRLRAMGRGVDRGVRIIPRLLFAFWVVAFWGMMLQTGTMLERWERTRGLPNWALARVMWAIALGGVISGVAAGVIVVS